MEGVKTPGGGRGSLNPVCKGRETLTPPKILKLGVYPLIATVVKTRPRLQEKCTDTPESVKNMVDSPFRMTFLGHFRPFFGHFCQFLCDPLLI